MQQNKNVKKEFSLLKKILTRGNGSSCAGGKYSNPFSLHLFPGTQPGEEIERFCQHHTHSKQQHLNFPVVVLNINRIIQILFTFHKTSFLYALH